MSWCSQNLITTTVHSDSQMASTRFLIRPTVQTASAIRGISAEIGLSGRLGRTLRLLTPVLSAAQTTFGKANTLLCSVSFTVTAIHIMAEWC